MTLVKGNLSNLSQRKLQRHARYRHTFCHNEVHYHVLGDNSASFTRNCIELSLDNIIRWTRELPRRSNNTRISCVICYRLVHNRRGRIRFEWASLDELHVVVYREQLLCMASPCGQSSPVVITLWPRWSSPAGHAGSALASPTTVIMVTWHHPDAPSYALRFVCVTAEFLETNEFLNFRQNFIKKNQFGFVNVFQLNFTFYDFKQCANMF